MKRFFGAIRRFFLPPADAKTFMRVIPLIAVAFIMIVVFALATVAWEESNAPSFCGLTCHTMPPEYVTYQHSSHTNVTCEDCHMGRDRMGIMVGRKIRYSWQTGTAMVFNTYEYPIYARNMVPARDACENCHKPEVLSTDKLVELKHFAEDETNSLTSTFLVVKTGGGTLRQGLGYGIHWHIENPVYFYTADEHQQEIPYVVVENADGTKTEYVDIESGFDPASVKPEELVKMDCITCHNRTAHLVQSPQRATDELLARGLVSPEIPNIKKKSVELLSAEYGSEQEALDAIAALDGLYKSSFADYYSSNQETIAKAITALQEAYQRTNFVDQKVNWQTHANNLAHLESPGCLRCHDGKHMTSDNQSVRLECNLCHSIPVVSQPNQLTASLELSKGFEPPSHTSPNWIGLHNTVYNETCAGCHTVDDPGGVSNTSFCSNSACHGASWEFAGFDAPKLRAILAEEAKTLVPAETESGAPISGPATYETLAPVFADKCGSCHGDSAMAGLVLTTYEGLMKGAENGPVVTAGDPDNSVLVQVQTEEHFGQLSSEELDLVRQWITDGAPEK